MEALSQLDVTAPDHISVITRDGKVTISVLKDGTSVTLGFPIRSPWLDTTPRPPLQQSSPMVVKHQGIANSSSGNTANHQLNDSAQHNKRANDIGMRFQSKLTESQVIEMKQILADPELMSKFRSKTQAYKQLGQMYGVSGCRVQQIANGNGWNHIKV
jgi:hypothetical protein